MTHALIIGGTGMLRGATIALAQSFDTVSVVARERAKLLALRREYPQINPLPLDYTATSTFIQMIEDAADRHGNFDLVVSWIHETFPKTPLRLGQLLNGRKSRVSLYHLLGSAYSRPDRGALRLRQEFSEFREIAYRQVILGFVVENGHSRWLRDEEICSGVLRAIETEQECTTIGSVEPWNLRP